MLAMGISISLINGKDELDRILENINLDEFELTDSLQEQLDGSSQEEPALDRLPLWIRTVHWGWHPEKGVMWNCAWELTLARGLLCLLPSINAHESNYMQRLLEGGVYSFN